MRFDHGRLHLLLIAALLAAGGCTQAPAPDLAPAPTLPVSDGWPYPQDVPKVEKAVAGLAGQEPPDIVRYLLLHTATNARISPDGRLVAFTTSISGVPQLWTVGTRSGWPIQLTYGAGVRFYEWLPDGSGLIYGADTEGNEREGFYLISADGTNERQVLAPSEAFRVFGGLAPDGRRAVYSTTERNGVDFDLHLVDLMTGASRMIRQGSFGLFASKWQPGGTRILVSETRGEDANDLHLLDIETGAMETLFAPVDPSFYGSFQWLSDGSGFYMITNHQREHQAVALFDLARRELKFVWEPKRDVDDLALSSGERYLAWTENVGGFSELSVLDLSLRKRLEAPERLPQGVYQIDFAAHADELAVEVSGPQVPGDIWTWDLRRNRFRRATRSPEAGVLLSSAIAPVAVTFPAQDGVQIQGLLYLPHPQRVAAGSRPPVLVDVHGGPTSQARPSFQPVTQFLLTRGIAVLDLNFRGSTGFGKSFARLDNGRNRPNAVRDVVDALDFLQRDGRVDTTRAAVMGGSYGGYLTNAVMAEYPGRFDAGVSLVGVSDWVRALEEASPALKASDRLEYGDIHDPAEREFFQSISPLTNADAIRDPMLFIHGANDPRDPVTESDRMVERLRTNGVEVLYLRFPDEGHGLRKVDNRVHAYRAVASFLLEQLSR
ncbi:MAG TPA: S9 family peptidase [Thermoanaerobaculia bacterium]|nr:S9 family peptidase [Thermoanaerobaculia bacterium]